MKVGGKNVGSEKGNTDFQTAAFRLGYLYRDIETQLNDFSDETGGEITGADAARWVGTLLLAKAGRGVLDRAQHLSSLWGQTAKGHEVSSATPPVHVRPRHDEAPVKRHLSRKARAAISRAQKLRWKKQKEGRSVNRQLGAKGYWAAKTPKQRRAEMKRRFRVRVANRLVAL